MKKLILIMAVGLMTSGSYAGQNNGDLKASVDSLEYRKVVARNLMETCVHKVIKGFHKNFNSCDTPFKTAMVHSQLSEDEALSVLKDLIKTEKEKLRQRRMIHSATWYLIDEANRELN